ncbi:MAG: hypothetical protein FWE69_07130 [Clostridiales bacterium]|nr:hypothetical protein [Clostridiales bacterium]
MNSIIEDLYFGNVNPNESLWTRDTEYQRFAKQSVEKERELGNQLNGEEKKLFDGFVGATGNMHAAEVQLRFAQGFRLGARIMLEALAEN